MKENLTNKSPLKAILAYCLGCGDGTAHDVRQCERFTCPLYHWRFGKKPDCFKQEISGEERATMRERFFSRMGIGKNSEISGFDTEGERK